MERKRVEAVGAAVVDSAICVHRELGPGLLESAYQDCLAHELRSRGFDVVCEKQLPVVYKGRLLDVGYRIDMVVANGVVVENKVVEKILPIHRAQLLTYLRMSGLRLGYLLNWRVDLMKKGIRRMVFNL